ncbi:MAG: 3-beta hydroxysteroid dehydrogenase [Rhizobiales bacterium NRL2]|jgi:NADH dehydrogenase|nr:MAG: 3-beta hydroxysteroid dehydrogenase [Rhizobiales bacterium NRL2]
MRGKRVAVFGGSGFVGRHLVRRLAQAGAQVTVAVRDPEAALFLKPMGDVGQITPLYANIRKPKTVQRAVETADMVVNLVGVLHQGEQSFAAAHAMGPKHIAEAAAAAGVETFVQMSALGVSADSPSLYGRTKAAGEAAVLEAVPTANIVRPSVIFGPEDTFLNRFAAMARLSPVLPLIGGGTTRFQPVFVGDVADAFMALLQGRGEPGAAYDLGGPRIYTFKEILEFIMQATGRRRLLVPIPFGVARIQGALLQLLPSPPLTLDQVKSLEGDNVVEGGNPGFGELGIENLSLMEAVAPAYLQRYARGGRIRSLDVG